MASHVEQRNSTTRDSPPRRQIKRPKTERGAENGKRNPWQTLRDNVMDSFSTDSQHEIGLALPCDQQR